MVGSLQHEELYKTPTELGRLRTTAFESFPLKCRTSIELQICKSKVRPKIILEKKLLNSLGDSGIQLRAPKHCSKLMLWRMVPEDQGQLLKQSRSLRCSKLGTLGALGDRG